ncbi:MAG: permease, partial [Bacteroidaceae bacterium]|nr:permease [Bacteroidaceae bacterium]
DSIIATYSLMGLPFAVIRPVVALLTAIFGGTLCNVVENVDDNNNLNANLSANLSDDKKPTSSSTLTSKRLRRAFAYAFGEMMEDIGKWLAIGLVVAGIITAIVPDSWFVVFQDNTLYSILFVLLFSIPMYLCATGSIPIAMALMLKGLTPGAALVLLMAGPACNAASILVVGKVLGKRTMLIYLVSIVMGAIVSGYVIDYMLPREWFNAPISHYAACHEEGVGLFSYLCTAFLLVCLVHALWPWKQHHHHHHHAEAACVVYRVEGMNCNHCAENVRKAIAAVEGVEQVEVSLHEGTASVAGSAKEDKIMQAIESIGFKASKSPD